RREGGHFESHRLRELHGEVSEPADRDDADAAGAVPGRCEKLLERTEDGGAAAEKRRVLGGREPLRHRKAVTEIGHVIVGVTAPAVDAGRAPRLAHIVASGSAVVAVTARGSQPAD